MTAVASFKHGLSGYSYWKCRCDVCREANNAKARRRWRRQNPLLVGVVRTPTPPKPRRSRIAVARESANTETVQSAAQKPPFRPAVSPPDAETDTLRRILWAYRNSGMVPADVGEEHPAELEALQAARRIDVAVWAGRPQEADPWRPVLNESVRRLRRELAASRQPSFAG